MVSALVRTPAVAILVSAVLLSGCRAAEPDPNLEPPPPAAEEIVPPAPAEASEASLYWVSAGENLLGVAREVPASDEPARTAMEQLLLGPTPGELTTWPAISTAIPEGTRLLGLSVEDGVAVVDLSGEFASGGGSFSVIARLAQVTHTLCGVPGIEAVEFWLDGEPVGVFSSEGLILDGPQVPEDFDVPVDA